MNLTGRGPGRDKGGVQSGRISQNFSRIFQSDKVGGRKCRAQEREAGGFWDGGCRGDDPRVGAAEDYAGERSHCVELIAVVRRWCINTGRAKERFTNIVRSWIVALIIIQNGVVSVSVPKIIE